MALPTPTVTGIYNRALALLGSVDRSVNVDDTKPWTDTLNELWPDAVRDLHAEHPWNHAIRRATLNLKEQNVDGYLYSLPADCVRWLPPARDSMAYFRGAQEGRFLLTDSDTPPRIRYVTAVENVAEWPPHFITAMGYRLAMDAAEPITQSSGVVEAMRVKYEGNDGEGGALAKAKRADGLATGDRDRGDVSVFSRTLTAAGTSTVGMSPSSGWG
ncbi:MAG: hypothetical protein CL802_13490 [Citromicrobium sp.]|nr:hypothetical protein [Citromicrobium sp.]|tara:strand:+ start:3082 stop:3726 length:645 start_codon:yes stop_codon:yes gene_type:complete